MSHLCAITGLGLVTPLGRSAAMTWSALLAGRAISNHARVSLEDDDRVPRVDRMALAAAREAFRSTRKSVALVFGTSKGPVIDWMPPLPHMARTTCMVGGSEGSYGLASTTQYLCKELKLAPGPRLNLSAACASGLDALIRGAIMIQSGEARQALIVGAEASVHPLFVGSFRRLGVLPREGMACRPFDRDREGFLISEAAAAVTLEAFDPEQRDGMPPVALVDRHALAGDATHLTASDPGGKTLRAMLRKVVDGRRVDLIHAHATGTVQNDPVELAVYEAECGDDQLPPIVYSHKGALGHSLGAAGLVSVVLNCLAHRDGAVPGNVQCRNPLAVRRVRLPGEKTVAVIRRSIVAAAGFGGAMAAVSLKSP